MTQDTSYTDYSELEIVQAVRNSVILKEIHPSSLSNIGAHFPTVFRIKEWYWKWVYRTYSPGAMQAYLNIFKYYWQYPESEQTFLLKQLYQQYGVLPIQNPFPVNDPNEILYPSGYFCTMDLEIQLLYLLQRKMAQARQNQEITTPVPTVPWPTVDDALQHNENTEKDIAVRQYVMAKKRLFILVTHLNHSNTVFESIHPDNLLISAMDLLDTPEFSEKEKRILTHHLTRLHWLPSTYKKGNNV